MYKLENTQLLNMEYVLMYLYKLNINNVNCTNCEGVINVVFIIKFQIVKLTRSSIIITNPLVFELKK